MSSFAILRSILILVCTLGALSGCKTAELKTSLNASDAGPFSYPAELYWRGKKVNGLGTLDFPQNTTGKVPVVVLVHGTAGVGYREHSWSGFLNEKGYATFTLDYFTQRGVTSQSRDLPRAPQDVWYALNFLSTHPLLDMDRVAVMGFSNGGTLTSASVLARPSDTNGVLPKAYIMVYGGCHTPANPSSSDYKPALLYIAGSKDALVPASTCLDRKADTGTDNIDVMVIDGAYHLFDGNSSQTFTHPKWGSVTVKADPAATEKARSRVTSLLAQVL